MLALIGLLAYITPSPQAGAAAIPVQVDEVVPASLTRTSHFRVGPNSVLGLEGPWDTDNLGCSRVSRALTPYSSVLVLQGDKVYRYKMTGSGELVEGSKWFVIRPGDCKGPGSQVPWFGGSESFAPAPAASLCTPVVDEFPRSDLETITFDGKCWETTGSGQCGTTKTCGTASESFCSVVWTRNQGADGDELSECGGAGAVNFHCTNGFPTVRICN